MLPEKMEPKHWFIVFVVFVFLLGVILTNIFGRVGGRGGTAAPSPASSSISVPTKTVTVKPVVKAFGDETEEPSSNAIPNDSIPSQGKSAIPIWKSGMEAPTFDVASGVDKSVAPLASLVFSQWYPNFTKFVNYFGETYTDKQKSEWKGKVVPLANEILAPKLAATEENEYLPGTPVSYKVIRASEQWVTLTVTYDTFYLDLTLVQNASDPGQDWKVQFIQAY